MKQSKKITFFCTAMLASMALFAANDLMSNQATQAVKAATSLTVSSSINSYILNSKFAVSNVTKELHTFSMFNYSTSDKKPDGIVFHYTDNPNNYSARNEADYEINGGWQSAFVHTFIDASTILNIHDTDFGSWGGGPKANARFVQFELVTARNREEFAKSINNAAWYTASMAVKYNWTLTPATVNGGGTLWTHHDVTRYLGGTNHTDPDAYLAKWGYDTTQFLDLAKYYYSEMANRGNFYKVALTKNGLEISGWSAANASEGKKYSYLILMDADTNKEISRYQINRLVRTDVAKVYPNIYNSLNSGFSYTIPLSNNFTNKKIKIIARYSADPFGSTSYSDYESGTYDFTTNYGSFDSVVRNGDALQVRGWNATDGSASRPYHVIIVYDKKNNKEITRVSTGSIARNDVYQAYSSVYNSLNSGFYASIPIDKSLSDKDIYLVSRYSSAPNGQGDYVDKWSNKYQFNQNLGWIDFVKQNSTSLNIKGWNAADASFGRKYSFLFLMDQNNREIARYPLERMARPDVATKYPLLYNADQSGFNLNIPLTENLNNKKFTLKMRYSADSNGNTDFIDTNFSDVYQIKNQSGTENKASLDAISATNQSMTLQGWHATDYSAAQPYRYLFLMNKDTGVEVSRYRISSLSRPDVASVYPNIYGAGTSGFRVTVPITESLKNKNLTVMVRYSDDVNGNGNFTNYWFNNTLRL